MTKKLVKQLTYLGCGMLALVSVFLSFSNLVAKALSDNPVAKGTADAINKGMKANGLSRATFFEFIGDFADKSQIEHKASTVIAAILLFIAILCAGVVVYSAISSLIKRDSDVLESMGVRCASIIAFVTCLLALLIMLIFPDLPKGVANVYEYKGTIGVGSILFLLSTGLAAVFSFIHPKLLRD